MKKQLRSLLMVFLGLFGFSSYAQTTLNTTAVSGFANNNGSGIVSFNFQNTNAFNVIITDIEGITGTSGANTAELYINTTPISGSPGAISAANGWTLAASQSFTGVANTSALTTQVFMSGISVVIPANTTVGMVVFATGQRYHTMVSPNIPLTTVAGGGCNILMGANISYGGGNPPAAPTFTPRGWLGKITFVPATPCINPPTAGAATSTKLITCSGESFQLGLSGASMGTGQTYQWQSSPDSLVWTNISGATASSYTTNQTTTTYYRCGLTCTATVYSAGVKVTTNAVALPGGTYTINGGLATGGTNFNSFSDFRQAIVCGGIAGPVVVNVINKGSAYAEQVSFGQIGGTSATNTITINGNGQTISFGGGSQYGTMLFNGSQYFKIKNLKIEGTATTNCYGVHITGGSQFLEFDSCQVSINPISTSSLTSPFVVSGSLTSATTAGASGKNIKITNSIIEGGYYGLAMTGPSAAPFNSGNVVMNNEIRDAYVYQCYIGYQDSLTFSGNNIHRENRTGTITTFYGVYIFGNATDLVCTNNRVHNPADQNPTASFTSYCLYFATANATAADPGLIANNAVYNINGDGTGATYGLYVPSGTYLDFYHNTISLDNTQATGASTQRALYFTATSGIFNIKNNLVSITRGGTGTKHLMYFSSTAPTYSINNNQYYMGSTAGSNFMAYWNAANVNTFSDWQAVNSGAFDQNGVNGDPVMDLSNYKPQSAPGNNAGANLLAIVPIDLAGIARTATPDIGALEYTPLACLQPFNINGSATLSTITLTWTNVSGADSVRIEYGGSGFTQGTGTAFFVTGDSTVITGLNSQTCYDFYLTTYCGGSAGNGYALYTICTPCGNQTMPYMQAFTTWPPQCFDFSSTGAWNWTQHSSGYAQALFWFNSTGVATMKTAKVSITAGAQVLFKWAHLYSATYPDDQLVVRARILNGTTWDTLANLKGPGFSSPNSSNTAPPASAADFILHTAYLPPSYIGQVAEFEFIALTDYGPNLYVDDFEVSLVPPCTPPIGLATANITATSAQATWSTISGTCFDIEYGPQGFIQGTGNGTLVSNVTSPYTMSNLTPNTFYDVYVRDCCNPNVWLGPVTFKTNCLSQLSGVYTIGGTPSATNFATLDSAIAVLTGCGVSGPVTFNLQGNVTKTIGGKVFGGITGASATNLVTFNGRGIGGDTIKFNNGVVAFDFDGSSYLTFQNLTINASGADRPIWLHDGAHHLTFNNCHILGNATSTSALTCVIAATSTTTSLSSTGDNANAITVTNCKLVGGYYGFTVYGTGTTSFGQNYTLTNNVFEDQYFYGIRFYYASNITLEGNTVILDRNTSGYAYYGFYNSGVTIKRNEFFANTYAMYFSQFNTTLPPTTNSEISNNFIGGGTYGMYMTTYAKLNLWHNSFRGTTSGAYMLTPSGDVDVRNNIFVGGTSYAFYNSTNPTTGYVLNYNLYHATGANLAYMGAAFTSLAAWQTAQTAFNANSLAGDPLYISNSDFHILGTLPNNAGVNGLATVDIDGDTRPASGSTTVDIGADEFTPLQWDAALEDLQVSLAGCGDSNTTISVEVKNLGQNTITSLPVVVQVSGGVTATLNYTYTQSIASGATATFTLGTINTASGPSGVNFTGYTSLATDQKTSNDTMTVGPGAYFPYVPQYNMPDTVCATLDSATFSAVSIPGLEYGWFANPNDTVPLVNGDSITFALSGQQTWYLGYTGSGEQTLSTTYVGGNSCGGGVMFNITAISNLNITGFNVSTTNAIGTATPLVVYYIPNGTYLGNETNAGAWTLHSSTTAPSAGSGNPTVETLPNSLIIPAGSTYAIYLNYASAYTNGNGTNQVYSNADMTVNAGIGMCGLFTGANNPRVFNGGITYGSAACSQIKVPVTLPLRADSAVADYSFTVLANGADVNFDASTSQGQQYFWDFGDGTNATGMMTSHTYAQGGTYTVCLGVLDTVCNSTDTICKQVLVTVGIDEGLIGQSLNLYPNPNNGNFRVEFQVEGLKDVELRVMNMVGQTVYQGKPGNVSGSYREDIDLSKQAAGIYTLQIITEDGTVSRKVTVRK